MENNHYQPTGNHKWDAFYLMLVVTGTALSQIQIFVASVLPFITAAGALLFLINQAFTAHLNYKNRKK